LDPVTEKVSMSLVFPHDYSTGIVSGHSSAVSSTDGVRAADGTAPAALCSVALNGPEYRGAGVVRAFRRALGESLSGN
jgi:hypothetical protein